MPNWHSSEYSISRYINKRRQIIQQLRVAVNVSTASAAIMKVQSGHHSNPIQVNPSARLRKAFCCLFDNLNLPPNEG